jgi:AraC family transcriptional regulator
MSTCSPVPGFGSRRHRAGFSHVSQAVALSGGNTQSSRRREEAGTQHGRQAHRISVTAAAPTIDIYPPEVAGRRVKMCDRMAADLLQSTRQTRVEISFRAPVHVLVVVEQGVRFSGDTFVEGLPRSALRDLRRKLTFVPAGHAYRECQEPSLLFRATYFSFDPAQPFEPAHASTLHAPRLFFEDPALLETGCKLRRLMEVPEVHDRLYIDALGVILLHELARPHVEPVQPQAPARGGLAAWQQRILADYIEAHLAEQMPLAQLAALVQLSPYHFCRAFKQSFGLPPHRYHTSRRIERAKALLAKPDYSVTEIGMTVGFSETSSFTAAFRRATGLTPTAYHRSLGA